MEHLSSLKIGFLAAIAAIGAWLGILGPMLIILLVLMTLDYVTGFWASKHLGALSSKKGVQGIIKKVVYIIIIVVSLLLDYLILITTDQLGFVLPFTTFFGLLTTTWFIVNEMLSILENAVILESKFPSFLKNFLLKFSEYIEKKGNDEADKIQ